VDFVQCNVTYAHLGWFADLLVVEVFSWAWEVRVDRFDMFVTSGLFPPPIVALLVLFFDWVYDFRYASGELSAKE
jgi:hypothetical protein